MKTIFKIYIKKNYIMDINVAKHWFIKIKFFGGFTIMSG